MIQLLNFAIEALAIVLNLLIINIQKKTEQKTKNKKKNRYLFKVPYN